MIEESTNLQRSVRAVPRCCQIAPHSTSPHRKEPVSMSIFSRTTVDATAGSAALEFDPATSALADVTGDYSLDATHTRIGFSARHAMVTTVRGQFDEFEGSAHLDLNNPAASSANVRIKVASVSTGQEQRDEHLRTG